MPQPIPRAKLLHLTDREKWRAWLKKNCRMKSEIWLVYTTKHTGRPRISYNDAVEEALCFGWIDSTIRAVDEDHFAQRISVRKARSTYSQSNIERLRALVRDGLVMDQVLQTLPDLSEDAFEMPLDILAAIKSDKEAWKHFGGFSQAYIRIRIAYIEGARSRPDEFKKRLAHFIRMSGKNKRIGFGGIEKHY